MTNTAHEGKARLINWVSGAFAVLAIISFVHKQSRQFAFAPPMIKAAELLNESRLLGDRSATVTIVVFSDYSCGWCQRFATTLDTLLSRDAHVRVAYRDFVLDTLGPALLTHAGARCAADQSHFVEFHNSAFRAFRLAALTDWHRRIARKTPSLDLENYEACVQDAEVAAAVRQETREARELGFSMTPSGYVGPIRFEGALSATQLDSLIHVASRRPGVE